MMGAMLPGGFFLTIGLKYSVGNGVRYIWVGEFGQEFSREAISAGRVDL
jgi:hypothetical protein